MMKNQKLIKQPLLGIYATVIVIVIALAIIIWFPTSSFLTWGSYLFMTAIPIQIIFGLVWQNNYPAPASKLEQPLKGLYLLVASLLVGAIVASVTLKTIGGYILPPTPFVIMFTILSVVLTLWLVIAWQCWPMTAITSHPAYIGFGTLFLVYVLDVIIYRLFMNFSFLQGAPIYSAAIDPAGAFNAWTTVSFAVTTGAVLLATVELDFWPINKLYAKSPSFSKQPMTGIINAIWILFVAWVIWMLFNKGFHMDTGIYMVRVPVCIIFGEFIMINLFQTAPFQTMKQPLKGFVLILANILLAIVMYYVYTWFSLLITGGLVSGPPAYDHELWIAGALLSITFPVISVFTGFFNFWPLTEPNPEPRSMEQPVKA